MIRGTTPTHIFHLQIDTATIKEVRITYVQYSKTLVEKTERDVIMEDKSIRLKLTQDETLKFSKSTPVRIQLKVLTTDNTVLACPVKELPIEDILNEEVLE